MIGDTSNEVVDVPSPLEITFQIFDYFNQTMYLIAYLGFGVPKVFDIAE